MFFKPLIEQFQVMGSFHLVGLVIPYILPYLIKPVPGTGQKSVEKKES